MPKDIKKEELSFDGSVKLNSKGEAILGRLSGPVAEFIAPTRNGRMYDEETWDKVFQRPIVQEMFEAGGLLGELNHPEDRLETDLSKVCVCMPERPKKDKNGVLMGYFDILDTPNGRIVATLAKYGYKLGCSSRADGETFEGYDGKNHVDPDTFDLKGWDIVLLPSVKKARLKLEESLVSGDVKAALREQINGSNDNDRQIMLESLNSLHIDIQEDKTSEVVEEPELAAGDAGAEIVSQLQEALKLNRALEEQVSELQEKLSVCYAKESKLEEELARRNHSIAVLSDGVKAAKGLKEKNESLTEELSKRDVVISEQSKKIQRLTESQHRTAKERTTLTESMEQSATKISKLEGSLEIEKRRSESERQTLLENIADIKKDSELKTKQYNAKIKRANELVEHYRGVAQSAVDKYIASKATMYGVTPQEIKSRLNESYTISDIDRVCEDLRSYKLNISKLPFDVTRGRKVQIQESVESIKPKSTSDDEVDESLLQLANLK